MSLLNIRSQIKTKLEEISGVENVYDYKRYCNDLATYKDLFIKDSIVNTWEIIRESFSKTAHGGNGNVQDTDNEFTIRGFYSTNDALASEKTFQDLVETIIQSFLSDPTLGGKAEQIYVPITGQFSYGQLGNVLCHIVQIKISIKDRVRL